MPIKCVYSQREPGLCVLMFSLDFVFLPCLLKISSFQESEMNSVINNLMSVQQLLTVCHICFSVGLSGRCMSLLWLGWSVCLSVSLPVRPFRSLSKHSWLIFVSLSFLSWSLLLFFYFLNHLKATTL